ncbi:hypothetical protein BASA50_004706 [Batrachochytrium salamandrivorans]|uniref:Uncharacterized protein n=1 Tax=Batrachochytrium salamandrivorans TaxID=1357716 RepID=A0ABQ8FHP7_9FUNG|nr:hypothetical protein BASA50_004706 [Batrachochytrium salamandrivorans]
MARIKRRTRGTAKSKTSVPNPDSSQKPYVYVKDTFDFYKSYKPGDSTQEGPTNFPVYVLTQDDKAKGARKKVYTGLGSGRGKSRFDDAPGGSSSRVLGSIKKVLSRVKLEVELSYGRQMASSPLNRVSTILAVERVESDYPEWLKELGISDNVYLEGLEMHTKEVEKYKDNLSDRFNKIKKMVEDYRKNSNQRSSSKASSSSLESKKHPEVESKPSENGASSSSQSKSEASSSAQSKSEASSSAQSKDGASSIAQSKSEASGSAPSEDGVVYNLIDFSDDE